MPKKRHRVYLGLGLDKSKKPVKRRLHISWSHWTHIGQTI